MTQYLKYILLLLISLFFLCFGVQVLLSAYRMNDPFVFVMTFFASNLIILISAAMILGFVLRLLRGRKPSRSQTPPEGQAPSH